MFNHRYFGTRYFGDRYWPKHGSGATAALVVSRKHDTITQTNGAVVDVMFLDVTGSAAGALVVSREQGTSGTIDTVELEVAGV